MEPAIDQRWSGSDYETRAAEENKLPGQASSRVGTCALCQKHGGLCLSHLLPKALYRWIQRSTAGQKNANAVHVTAKQATTKSFQIAEYLLCPECEERLRVGGEDWVLANGFRGTGSFPIHSVLAGATPFAKLTQASIIDARAIAGIDLQQLAYFALSVFWRAGACQWNALDHYSQISLGPYQETLRQYLLGGSFPYQAILIANVADNPSPQLGAVFPYSNRVNGVWQHRFSMPGMAFWLHHGRFKDQLPALCAVRSGVICHAAKLDDNYEREMGALIRSAKPSAALR